MIATCPDYTPSGLRKYNAIFTVGDYPVIVHGVAPIQVSAPEIVGRWPLGELPERAPWPVISDISEIAEIPEIVCEVTNCMLCYKMYHRLHFAQVYKPL